MTKTTNKLSVAIITYNEIDYIEKCIAAVSFADEIVVVDSYSADGTYEFLQSHPQVRVLQHTFENFTLQKSFALEQVQHNWVLFIDADEIVTADLRDEITEILLKPTDKVAYWFYRQFMFQQQKLSYSGWQTDKNFRLFKKSNVKFLDSKIVHETLEVDGEVGVLKNKLIHYCYKNFEDYKSKMLKYGKLKAVQAFYTEKKFSYVFMVLKPSWKFFNHYFLRLGFLDGKKGLIISYLNALGVYARYKELKNLEKKNKLAHYLVMP